MRYPNLTKETTGALRELVATAKSMKLNLRAENTTELDTYIREAEEVIAARTATIAREMGVDNA